MNYNIISQEVYRDMEYVKTECENLCEQISEFSFTFKRDDIIVLISLFQVTQVLLFSKKAFLAFPVYSSIISEFPPYGMKMELHFDIISYILVAFSKSIFYITITTVYPFSK
jgi:hypothetical protein